MRPFISFVIFSLSVFASTAPAGVQRSSECQSAIQSVSVHARTVGMYEAMIEMFSGSPRGNPRRAELQYENQVSLDKAKAALDQSMLNAFESCEKK